MNMHSSPILTRPFAEKCFLIFKLEYNLTAATSNKLHFVCTVCMFCITGIILYVTMRERENEREGEREQTRTKQERENERKRERERSDYDEEYSMPFFKTRQPFG